VALAGLPDLVMRMQEGNFTLSERNYKWLLASAGAILIILVRMLWPSSASRTWVAIELGIGIGIYVAWLVFAFVCVNRYPMNDPDMTGHQLRIFAETGEFVVPGSTVIRDKHHLARLRGGDPDRISVDVAKILKVDSIDWNKQMLIVISGGEQPRAGYRVERKKLDIHKYKLTVHWALVEPSTPAKGKQVPTTPTWTILLERFDGDVVFDPKSAPPPNW